MGGTFVESYSNPAVGTNLASGKAWASVKRASRIVKAGFAGGAAVYDGEIEIYYGQEQIANMYNNLTNATPQLKPYAMWISSNKRCPAGDQINIDLVQATGSNNYYLFVDIREG